MNKITVGKINLRNKIATLLLLYSFTSQLQAQIMTQPLFMQIKSPKLESNVGTQIPTHPNLFHINSTNRDSIDISFFISVPKEMLSEKWAISLAPSLYSSTENGRLKEVVVKGWKFAEAQESDYQRYNKYVNSIIDSSLYEKMYIDQERLKKEIENRHDMYWKFYYDEWERQIEYEKWKAKQDGSLQTFSVKDRLSYEELLRNQYMLRIKNQSRRYLEANMDTTGLSDKYMKEFKIHNAKMPRYFVSESVPSNRVPKKFKGIHKSGRTLQDITDSMLELLVKRDSALMALPILDYSKIIENEKKTFLKNSIYEDIIQLPRNENALLDTIVYDMRTDYRYLYTYRYSVRTGVSDTIKVKLNTKILATDGSGFSTSSEDVLVYIVATHLDIIKLESDKLDVDIYDDPKEREGERGQQRKENELDKKDAELLKRVSKGLQMLSSPPTNTDTIPLPAKAFSTDKKIPLAKRIKI